VSIRCANDQACFNIFKDVEETDEEWQRREKEEKKRLDKMEKLRQVRIQRMQAFQARTEIQEDKVIYRDCIEKKTIEFYVISLKTPKNRFYYLCYLSKDAGFVHESFQNKMNQVI
jgi:hypothetical protein